MCINIFKGTKLLYTIKADKSDLMIYMAAKQISIMGDHNTYNVLSCTLTSYLDSVAGLLIQVD